VCPFAHAAICGAVGIDASVRVVLSDPSEHAGVR
jgi:hypothetical protein